MSAIVKWSGNQPCLDYRTDDLLCQSLISFGWHAFVLAGWGRVGESSKSWQILLVADYAVAVPVNHTAGIGKIERKAARDADRGP